MRLVLAVSKTITDLERIGDEVEKVGRIALGLITSESPKSYYIGIIAMGIFLGILVIGFIYEWKKGALEWE